VQKGRKNTLRDEQMSDQAKEAQLAYRREWARKNPDKIRAQQRRYWEKRAKRQQEAQNEARKN
jgi:hypothetical protein